MDGGEKRGGKKEFIDRAIASEFDGTETIMDSTIHPVRCLFIVVALSLLATRQNKTEIGRTQQLYRADNFITPRGYFSELTLRHVAAAHTQLRAVIPSCFPLPSSLVFRQPQRRRKRMHNRRIWYSTSRRFDDCAFFFRIVFNLSAYSVFVKIIFPKLF